MNAVGVSWKQLLFEGIVFTLLGLFAISNPIVMSLSIEWVLGILLVIGGAVQGIRALTSLKEEGSVVWLIGAAIALITGILLLSHPFVGMISLTLILSAYLIIDGVTKIINSCSFRPMQGWYWLFFSGLLSGLLGFLILSGWPSTAMWVIGLYVGISLLFLGISLIMLSLSLKKAAPPA